MKFKFVYVKYIHLNLNLKRILNIKNNYFVIDQYLHTGSEKFFSPGVNNREQDERKYSFKFTFFAQTLNCI